MTRSSKLILTRLSHKLFHFSFFALTCACLPGVGQAAPRVVKAGSLSTKEAHRSIIPSLIPKGASQLRFQDGQAVVVSGEESLLVIPVSFELATTDPLLEGATSSLCGVFLMPRKGHPHLLTTLGVGNTEMMSCGAVKAIGGAPSATVAMPDLILTYDAYTGKDSFTATIVLIWDGKAGTYAVDDALSQWLGEQKDGGTVAGARRLLAKKRASGAGAGA